VQVMQRRHFMSQPASPTTEKLELHERLVATNPQVQRKGATMPCTSVHGHMFSFMTKTGTLALRLPTGEREAFLKKYKTRLCEQHGTVMVKYVEVPDALLRRTQELKKFFELSYEYVSSLKPKATKKRATGKKQST
jgi:TfoX/Sxy family transcriptional regulator of competence genes